MALCQVIYTRAEADDTTTQVRGQVEQEEGVCLFTKMATLPGTAVTTAKTEATLARLYKDIYSYLDLLT